MSTPTNDATTEDRLHALWRQPTAAFRGKPFWSWNGRLEKEELLRQARVFAEMGMGGFFMHSRTGLVTEYLGDEWFELINACSDEAKRLGLEAWLYDEDRWPSGSAGGLATREARFRMKLLRCTVAAPDVAVPWDEPGFVAAFAARVEGVNIFGARRLSAEGGAPVPEAGESLLLFTTEILPEDSFYNGQTYLDTLSRDATEHFLQVTHERYLARCDGRLGGDIRGVFTDEPHHGMVMCDANAQQRNRDAKWTTPWTPSLFGRFQEAFGHDLRDHLPTLFLRLEGERISPVKWQYMELIQRMFLDQWAQPLHGWCRAHGMLLTGHALHEDSLAAQAVPCGSMMRYYEHMDYPGVDVLATNNRNYWLVKQLASVGRQMGKPWLLSELYGCTGWQFDFAGHKAVGDWQALFGINVRCHHLAWYTMAGEAKRDYPASISFQSGWYKEYAAVEDYFSRLGVLMQAGRAVCDVLVLNPVESTWAQVYAGWSTWLGSNSPAVDTLERQYAQVFRWLTGAQIDFDYGDEDHLHRWGRVEPAAGAGEGGDGPMLVLGECAYRVVVVAGVETIRGSTLDLLRRFAEAGGAVVFAGEPPAYVDALPSGEAVRLAEGRRVAWRADRLAAAVRGASQAARVVRCGTPGMLCQVRRDGERWIVVAVNPDEETTLPDVRFCLTHVAPDAAGHSVEEWDCLRGDCYRVEASAGAEGLAWTASFPPLAERVFVLAARAGAADLPTRAARPAGKDNPMAGPFAYSLDEPNLCVLDFAAWRLGDGPWQPEAEILRIDEAVRAQVGLEPRGGMMVQPWARAADERTFGELRLRFAFDVAEVPAGEFHLLVETPERFQITLNGVAVQAADGWLIDPCLRRCAPSSPEALRVGRNEVELVAPMSAGLDLEAIFLAGNFGVTLVGRTARLGALPERLRVGDIVAQGLPFYSGKVTVQLPLPPGSGAPGVLTLDPVGCAAVKVCASNGAERLLPWGPFEVDLRELGVQAGEELTCELYLTRRNTFGPLHEVPKEQAACGPGNFRTRSDKFSEDYQLFPCGLAADPTVSIP